MPLSFLTRDFLISLNSEAEANMGSDWLSSSSNICEGENILKVASSLQSHLGEVVTEQILCRGPLLWIVNKTKTEKILPFLGEMFGNLRGLAHTHL